MCPSAPALKTRALESNLLAGQLPSFCGVQPSWSQTSAEYTMPPLNLIPPSQQAAATSSSPWSHWLFLSRCPLVPQLFRSVFQGRRVAWTYAASRPLCLPSEQEQAAWTHMVSRPLWKLELDGWGRGFCSTTANLPPHDLRLLDSLGSVTLDRGKPVSGSLTAPGLWRQQPAGSWTAWPCSRGAERVKVCARPAASRLGGGAAVGSVSSSPSA